MKILSVSVVDMSATYFSDFNKNFVLFFVLFVSMRCDCVWLNWKSMGNSIFISNAVDPRHNNHIKNCCLTSDYCTVLLRTIFYSLHSMVCGHDKQFYRLWLSKKKSESKIKNQKPPAKPSTMVIFLFTVKNNITFYRKISASLPTNSFKINYLFVKNLL